MTAGAAVLWLGCLWLAPGVTPELPSRSCCCSRRSARPARWSGV